MRSRVIDEQLFQFGIIQTVGTLQPVSLDLQQGDEIELQVLSSSSAAFVNLYPKQSTTANEAIRQVRIGTTAAQGPAHPVRTLVKSGKYSLEATNAAGQTCTVLVRLHRAQP